MLGPVAGLLGSAIGSIDRGGPKPGLQAHAVELSRLGLVKEPLESSEELGRRLELRLMSNSVKNLEAAAGDG